MSVVASPVRSVGPLSEELVAVAGQWARNQHRIVVLAAEFAQSSEWIEAESPTAAHWLAGLADVEVCTAREWVRTGRKLADLPLIAAAFAAGQLSYAKVRTLTRVAQPLVEAELLDLATKVPAGELGRALAAWLNRNCDPEDLAEHHEQQRSVTWRHEPDGMVTFTLRLPPLLAGTLIAWLTTWVMTKRPPIATRDAECPSAGAPTPTRPGSGASAGAYPSMTQQQADALKALVSGGDGGQMLTEVVIHVRGDGCALDDGTPVLDTVVERIAPSSFIRALVHDAQGRPIDVSGRRRHPTRRQKRLVKERDRVCRDCGRADLIEYDHVPSYEQTGHTHVDELELRCAPCHRRRHTHD